MTPSPERVALLNLRDHLARVPEAKRLGALRQETRRQLALFGGESWRPFVQALKRALEPGVSPLAAVDAELEAM